MTEDERMEFYRYIMKRIGWSYSNRVWRYKLLQWPKNSLMALEHIDKPKLDKLFNTE